MSHILGTRDSKDQASSRSDWPTQYTLRIISSRCGFATSDNHFQSSVNRHHESTQHNDHISLFYRLISYKNTPKTWISFSEESWSTAAEISTASSRLCLHHQHGGNQRGDLSVTNLADCNRDRSHRCWGHRFLVCKNEIFLILSLYDMNSAVASLNILLLMTLEDDSRWAGIYSHF